MWKQGQEVGSKKAWLCVVFLPMLFRTRDPPLSPRRSDTPQQGQADGAGPAWEVSWRTARAHRLCPHPSLTWTLEETEVLDHWGGSRTVGQPLQPSGIESKLLKSES